MAGLVCFLFFPQFLLLSGKLFINISVSMKTFIWISGGEISGSEYLCLVNTAGNDQSSHCFIHCPTFGLSVCEDAGAGAGRLQ